MPRPSFYNDNMGRDYPFIHGQADELPKFAICDFGCTMAAGSGFVEGVHGVYLAAIRKLPDRVEYEFITDAPGLAGRSLIFGRDPADSRYVTSYAESSYASGYTSDIRCIITGDYEVEVIGGVSVSVCKDPPSESFCHEDVPWIGYLVTGDVQRTVEELDECEGSGWISFESGDADILLLTDTTGSMGAYIATIKAVFSPLASQLTTSMPNVNFQWAAASYKDFEDTGPYTSGLSIDRPFTADITAVQTAVNSWSPAGGGDGPEQQLAALKRIANEWETTFGGRPQPDPANPSISRAVVWAGDVAGWENGAKGRAYPRLQETIDALAAAGIVVYGINTRIAGSGIDSVGPGYSGTMTDGRNQATAIVTATGGALHNSVVATDATVVAQLVGDAILVVSGIDHINTCAGLSAPIPVEPSQITNFAGTYARSFYVANADRTRATTADECRDYCWPFVLDEHYVRCECIIGPLLFSAGYNTCIQLDPNENSITVDACLGGGDGVPCELPEVTDDEGPPAGRTLLDGSLGCDEIIRSINGIGRRYFQITGGGGVIVTAVPEQHKIVVDVRLHDLAICPELISESSLSLPAPNTDPCSCGPKE